MRHVIASLHCEETECGGCEHQLKTFDSPMWCELFRTVLDLRGKRSHYCLEAEAKLKELQDAKVKNQPPDLTAGEF